MLHFKYLTSKQEEKDTHTLPPPPHKYLPYCSKASKAHRASLEMPFLSFLSSSIPATSVQDPTMLSFPGALTQFLL